MFDLFVGDVGEYLAHIAHGHDADAQLLTTSDVSQATHYTSLADMGTLQDFQNICLRARQIWYCPPDRWTAPDHKAWTESVLAYVSQWIPCHGTLPNPYQWVQDQTVVPARAAPGPQIWSVGCSITAGVGVDEHERWPARVQRSLDLPMTDLSHPGSSVIWQSDQICRSPVNADDIVFWGVTTAQRLCVIKDQSVYHLNSRSFEQCADLAQHFSPHILDNDTLIYHTALAVKRAARYCEQTGAKLVALGLMHDLDGIWRCYDIPQFRQIMSWPAQYLDVGTDGLHPGPRQHLQFAQEFLTCLK
jgi:hypothetical protein